MTNYERYKEDIERITRLGLTFGMGKTTDKVEPCNCITCTDCKFFGACSTKKLKWAYEEYQELFIDWSKIPIDTKVLVSRSGKTWYKAYFAGVNASGNPMVWSTGSTGWSADGRRIMYEYIKLAEE